MILKISLALIGFLVVANAKSYENFKVYSIIPESLEHVQILTDLRKSGYDFWTDVFTIGNDVRIMVEPEKDNEFVNYAKTVGFNAVLQVPNVQELIDAQLKPALNVERSTLGSFSWDRYHTLPEIHAWLDELQELYPDVVTTVTIGTSIEGRPIKGVIIDHNPGRETPLIAMIEGGIHSREWISPATVTWIIKEFVTSTDPDVMFMAEAFIWHIFPVVNPDGYVYTFTDDRMWRKNRNTAHSTTCPSGNDLSNGIDLNRNFNYVWMSTGASDNPCTQTFAGPLATSELESRAISNYVLQLKRDGNLLYYFAFHSYSQLILVPYSHVSGFDVLQADNYGDLYEIAIRGAEKLTAKHGTTYTVGTSAEVLYEVSGSSFDWAKGAAGVPISYLFELRDVGQYGFLLPAEEIIPNNEEIMECLVEMDKTARKLGYYSGSTSVLSSMLSLAISVGLLIVVQ